MEKCGTLLDAVKDTLVLAFEFADKTLLNSPETIRKVLEDPKIQLAIKQAAQSEGRRLLEAQKGGKAVTNADGVKVLEAIGTAAKDAAIDSAKKQIEESDEFKKLKKEVENLSCALKQSPIGVFVDKNKGWLIVVGVGLGLGGVTAMYMFRSGDWVAGQATDLASKQLRFKVLGNVEFGASRLKFVPSSRQVGTTLFASAKWERVSVRLDLSVDFKNDQFQSTGGKVTTDFTVAKGLVLTGTGSAGYQVNKEPWKQSFVYHLGVGVTFKQAFGVNKLDVTARAFIEQTPEYFKQGGALDAKYNILSLPNKNQINLGVTGQIDNTRMFDPNLTPGSNQQGLGYKGMIMFEWKHDFLGGR